MSTPIDRPRDGLVIPLCLNTGVKALPFCKFKVLKMLKGTCQQHTFT